MSELSDSSEENQEPRDDKDSDFKLDDCRNEMDSDDSYCDLAEAANECNANDERNEECGGIILPGGHRFDKRFVCVKYPGNVVNYEKALETLGGLATISRAINTANRRLELRFRPDDGYCKPTCGDRHATNGFLLRIRVKKRRNSRSDESKNSTSENGSNCDKVANNTKKDGESIDFAAARVEIVDDAAISMKNAPKLQHSRAKWSRESDDGNVSINARNLPRNGDEKMAELINKVGNCQIEEWQQNGAAKNAASPFIRCEINAQKRNIAPTFDRDKYEDLSVDRDYELPRLKILGRIESEFRFNNLCDFQYLPLAKSSPSSSTSPSSNLSLIYRQIYPRNIPPNSWLRNRVPYFLPPAAFSRMDTIQKFAPKTESSSGVPGDVIGKSRKRKSGFSNFIYFNTPEVPKKPPIGIETAMKVKFILRAHFQTIRQVFEERPIWSKNAIMFKTSFSTERLKVLLPAVAYYCVTGPWKIMWVKLGYDPRKDVNARKYQTLDYRLKAMHGLGSTVKCKRSYSEFTLPYKSTPTAKQTIMRNAGSSRDVAARRDQEMNENVYIYREGTVPPSRQMFYQYCDVLVDEIQEMLAKLPDPLPTAKCDAKRGWLPNGFDAQCREIINKQVRAVLRKRMNIPDDQPTTLPRKRDREIKRNVQRKLRNSRKRKRRRSESGSSVDENGEENEVLVKSESN